MSGWPSQDHMQVSQVVMKSDKAYKCVHRSNNATHQPQSTSILVVCHTIDDCHVGEAGGGQLIAAGNGEG